MPNVFPVAPNYDDVRWPAKGGLRVPTEVHNAAIIVGKEVDINFATTPSPIQLSPDLAGGNYFTLIGATGASVVQFPYGNASKQFIVANHSGQAVTFQIAAAPGGSASTGVSVANGFRQILCIDRQVGDVRPAAAAIAY
jgi:hypothetical protein